MSAYRELASKDDNVGPVNNLGALESKRPATRQRLWWRRRKRRRDRLCTISCAILWRAAVSNPTTGVFLGTVREAFVWTRPLTPARQRSPNRHHHWERPRPGSARVRGGHSCIQCFCLASEPSHREFPGQRNYGKCWRTSTTSSSVWWRHFWAPLGNLACTGIVPRHRWHTGNKIISKLIKILKYGNFFF